MRERFPRRNNNNSRRTNDNRIDKSQRDYSGSSRKRKPDDLIAAVDRPPRGRKTMMHEQFEKLLQKKCPWHPGANHAAIDCYNLRRTFSNPNNDKKNKSMDKEPKEDNQGDKSRNAKFQDASKIINVIFGDDEEFSSWREQKLRLREIMSVKTAVPRPLRWSEVLISFSRDDQWTSFSEPGKFPLLLDPVVAQAKLTRVLIDGGSSLNLIIASMLRKMGLDLTDMIVPSKSPFHGIVLGNTVHPLGTVVSSHLRHEGELPYQVHQLRSCQLQIFISCHIGQAGTGQIYGSTALCLSTSQDARTKWPSRRSSSRRATHLRPLSSVQA
jgi:hypothetical protein